MKYTFNTLEEVKQAIEQWAKVLNYHTLENSNKQYLYVLDEIGEMTKEIVKCNEDKFKSEAGDVFVTIIVLCLKENRPLRFYKQRQELDNDINEYIRGLVSCWVEHRYINAIDFLEDICIYKNTTLLECATIAYNKIQGRLERGELSVKNGTVVKSGN